MKIIFYGTRDYDHLYFDVLAADPDYGCTIKFLAANLDPDTAQLAAGAVVHTCNPSTLGGQSRHQAAADALRGLQ